MTEDRFDDQKPLFPPNPIVDEIHAHLAQQRALRHGPRSPEVDAHIQRLLTDQGREGMVLALDLRDMLNVTKRQN